MHRASRINAGEVELERGGEGVARQILRHVFQLRLLREQRARLLGAETWLFLGSRMREVGRGRARLPGSSTSTSTIGRECDAF